MDMYIYTTPKDASVELELDNGYKAMGQPGTWNGRDDGHRLTFPDDSGLQGSVLRVRKDGYVAFDNRGLFTPQLGGDAEFRLDDVHLSEVPQPPPPDPGPAPGPATDPLGIINEVYATGRYNLATHEGCGLFTEECVRQLHERISPWYGHIAKSPGQNQFNGHAVDALMLLTGAGAGVYDIIFSSVSHEAKPTYNFAGPPNPELWYYPPAGQALSAKGLIDGLVRLLQQA